MFDKIIKTNKFVIGSGDLNELKGKLLKLDGVEAVNIADQTLIITYDLRQNNYQSLNLYLAKIVEMKNKSLLNKLKSDFISFYEQNELEHASHPCGWNYYMQNVYLSLHKEHY